tara:strand:+ start:2080 stop:2502 length:423 start_codon:yes stop_codon:yes gene_type:complete
MSIEHEILFSYIKDLSVETPNPDSLIVARERLSKYSLKLDITSKALKNKMIEVNTKLMYLDEEQKKNRTNFEMIYSTVINIKEEKPDKDKLARLLLCDVQIKIYPKIQKAFIEILKLSGFPEVKISGNIDFVKLYEKRKS